METGEWVHDPSPTQPWRYRWWEEGGLRQQSVILPERHPAPGDHLVEPGWYPIYPEHDTYRWWDGVAWESVDLFVPPPVPGRGRNDTPSGGVLTGFAALMVTLVILGVTAVFLHCR